MLDILKWVGYGLLSILGFGLALGIGVALSALSAVLGTVMLGGAALFAVILIVREFFEAK
jgi:hypothetical protein